VAKRETQLKQFVEKATKCNKTREGRLDREGKRRHEKERG